MTCRYHHLQPKYGGEKMPSFKETAKEQVNCATEAVTKTITKIPLTVGKHEVDRRENRGIGGVDGDYRYFTPAACAPQLPQSERAPVTDRIRIGDLCARNPVQTIRPSMSPRGVGIYRNTFGNTLSAVGKNVAGGAIVAGCGVLVASHFISEARQHHQKALETQQSSPGGRSI